MDKIINEYILSHSEAIAAISIITIFLSVYHTVITYALKLIGGI